MKQIPNDTGGWRSFLFLNNSTLLFHTDGKVSSDDSLDVFAITEGGTSIRHRTSFLLPSRLDSTLTTVTIAHVQNRPATVQASHGQIHVHDPEQSIIVLKLLLNSPRYRDDGEIYILVVEKLALLSRDHQSPSVDAPTSISWLDWSRRSRMLREPSIQFTCVHGTRYAGSFAHNNGHLLKVYDFNTRRRPVQLDQDDVVVPDREIVTVVEESTIQSRYFAHPVCTSLPYRVVSLRASSKWAATAMNEDYLIIVPLGFDHHVSSFH